MKETKIKLAIFSLLFGVLFGVQGQNWVTNGLVAYFPFNGNPNDMSGNGHNAQIYNPTNVILTADRFGNTGSAYSFGGNSIDGAETAIWGNGMNLAGTSLTISFWIKGQYTQVLDDFGGVGIGRTAPGTPNPGGSSGQNLHIYSSYERIRFSFFYNDCDAAQTVPVGQWAQLCFVFDNTNMSRKIFINGNEVSNCLAAYGFSGNDIFSINGRKVGMDDVRFYNRALSSSEVAQLHTIESAPRVDLVRAVKPSFSYMTAGTSYQLQISPDLNTWTNHGLSFTATNSTMTYPQYWDVDNWGKLFFRLQVLP